MAKATINLGDKITHSESFRDLFAQGMQLVEETAQYLDGDGRDASKDLPRTASLTYATESMRLTTRLMQMASWLLLHRAVSEGEMSLEQACQEKNKVRLGQLASATQGPGYDELPDMLKELIERSMRLQARVQHMDGLIYPVADDNEAPRLNPVSAQLEQLANALSQ